MWDIIGDLTAGAFGVAAVLFLTRKRLFSAQPVIEPPVFNFDKCRHCGALKPLGANMELWLLVHEPRCPENPQVDLAL